MILFENDRSVTARGEYKLSCWLIENILPQLPPLFSLCSVPLLLPSNPHPTQAAASLGMDFQPADVNTRTSRKDPPNGQRECFRLEMCLEELVATCKLHANVDILGVLENEVREKSAKISNIFSAPCTLLVKH